MIMRVVFKKALNEEMKAIEYISERLEGKVAVKQTLDWVKPISEINFEEIYNGILSYIIGFLTTIYLFLFTALFKVEVSISYV